MAQLNITFDQREILQMLADDTGSAYRELLRGALNAVLQAESAEQLGAERYERTGERSDMRNGTRSRSLTTRIGTIELTIPRHRNVPFKTLVFDNFCRSEGALITTMAEMVVGGVSTAKVGRVMEELCGKNFSRSTVSEACKELDVQVRQFRERPLKAEYPFVMVDATFPKAREDGRVRAKALMIAVGLTSEGTKEIIGFGVYDGEDADSWDNFISGLKRRGLHGVRLVTSDARPEIPIAFSRYFPDVPWQRCQAHFTRNISDAAPKKLRVGLRQELSEMFNSPTIDEARMRRDEIIADYGEVAPKAMERLDAGFDDAMSVMELPEILRKPVRTTNILERLNGEVGKRTKVIRVFPNVSSIERLIGALLDEENDRWQMKRKLYYKPAMMELKKCEPSLIVLAREQRRLREAA